jgi:hypothetical protein
VHMRARPPHLTGAVRSKTGECQVVAGSGSTLGLYFRDGLPPFSIARNSLSASQSTDCPSWASTGSIPWATSSALSFFRNASRQVLNSGSGHVFPSGRP